MHRKTAHVLETDGVAGKMTDAAAVNFNLIFALIKIVAVDIKAVYIFSQAATVDSNAF